LSSVAEDEDEALGRKIARYRQRRGLSQKEFAVSSLSPERQTRCLIDVARAQAQRRTSLVSRQR
jgi:hypothetical protein